MSIFDQMTQARTKLLADIKASEASALRSITDAAADTQARLAKLKTELEEEYAGLTAIVIDTYGKPDAAQAETKPAAPAAPETIIT